MTGSVRRRRGVPGSSDATSTSRERMASGGKSAVAINPQGSIQDPPPAQSPGDSRSAVHA